MSCWALYAIDCQSWLLNPWNIARITNDAEISKVLMKANYTDDDAKVHEITATRGFVFHYSDSGYDSIAYGGLKK